MREKRQTRILRARERVLYRERERCRVREIGEREERCRLRDKSRKRKMN